MDRSHEFHEIINHQQHNFEIPNDIRVKSGKQSLLLAKKPKGSKNDWTSSTDGLKNLVKTITKMRDFLIAKRKDYVNLQ